MKRVSVFEYGMKVPETRAEKIRVLKDARKLVKRGHSKGNWYEFVNGVEHYCLYGALEAAMGFDFDSFTENFSYDDEYDERCEPDPGDYAQLDRIVSSCSLTKTLFDAAQLSGKHADAVRFAEAGEWEKLASSDYVMKNFTVEQVKNRVDDAWVMRYRVIALQEMNDKQGKQRVLEALDQAIESLS